MEGPAVLKLKLQKKPSASLTAIRTHKGLFSFITTNTYSLSKTAIYTLN